MPCGRYVGSRRCGADSASPTRRARSRGSPHGPRRPRRAGPRNCRRRSMCLRPSRVRRSGRSPASASAAISCASCSRTSSGPGRSRSANTTVALSAGGDAIDPATIKPVTFGGSATAVIPPGAPLVSDPVDISVKPLSSVAVSFYLPKKTGVTSVHWDGAQTTYISAAGDKTKDADFKPDSTDKSRLFLSRILTTAKPELERDRVLRRFHHRRRLLDRRHEQPLARSHRRAAASRRPSGCRGRQRGLFRRSRADEWNGHQCAEPLRHIGARAIRASRRW